MLRELCAQAIQDSERLFIHPRVLIRRSHPNGDQSPPCRPRRSASRQRRTPSSWETTLSIWGMSWSPSDRNQPVAALRGAESKKRSCRGSAARRRIVHPPVYRAPNALLAVPMVNRYSHPATGRRAGRRYELGLSRPRSAIRPPPTPTSRPSSIRTNRASAPGLAPLAGSE